ncbi:Retrovirus-related Pol polyprotein from type-1 retrotransposable element R1 [Eumeta japonica]|uniref:Retrovirus-related Pol polyprotein from type-1 retrotransposable element R1 n=1 Tax=Eumeta variegata TaxID=151549 RepID=A0A4C1Y1F4_EUMVA|nr:Retrovirus-related Pol polyprotein from type-1 retrotransposable element R1 [Eumeta japonica]
MASVTTAATHHLASLFLNLLTFGSTDRGCEATSSSGDSRGLQRLGSGLGHGDRPTYTKGDASSIVDLTFVSTSLAKGSISWVVLDIYTASDHHAILWETSKDRNLRGPIKQTNTIEDHTKALMMRVTQACDASMPRKRVMNSRPAVHWWNDHISNLRKECHRKRRISQRSYKRPNSAVLIAEYKKARHELNKAIKESKSRCWKELIHEVDKDVWGRPYKVVMTHLKKQQMPSPTCPQLLQKIVTALFPQQRSFDYQLEPGELDDIPPVTEEELLEACNRVGNNKAPGLDGIPNIALKTIIKAAPSLFLEAYNSCLKEGLFLVNGNSNDWYCYRKRIDAVVDPLLADNQYGFRKGRSTLDAISLVVNTAKEAIAGTRWKGGAKKYCLVAALDIRNAFNSANWDCIMQALDEKNVPAYLRRLVVSYFTDRVLKYDTKNGPKEYDVTGGVPQGSVLGPLLWNIMYDGLLRLNLPRCVKLVAYADDVAAVIVAKHLDEIQHLFDITFKQINQWMDSVNLQLAKQKTEAVLITSRKKIETITLKVGDQEITSQPHIRYLGVKLDARLNFKQQVEHVCTKASAVRASLARLMPNVGGPKQSRRLLLSSVVTSVLTYGISIWADALETQDSWRKAGPIYRMSALRVASAFRTVSEEAVCVISGTLPLRVLAKERRNLYHRKTTTTLSAEELRIEERQKSIARWQRQWDAAEKGRWTHYLIPRIDVWLNRSHGEVNFYLTQMLSGHGCFREYLHRFKHDNSPECPSCPGVIENAKHVFFECPRFYPQRDQLENVLQQSIQPETIVEAMLSSKPLGTPSTHLQQKSS